MTHFDDSRADYFSKVKQRIQTRLERQRIAGDTTAVEDKAHKAARADVFVRLAVQVSVHCCIIYCAFCVMMLFASLPFSLRQASLLRQAWSDSANICSVYL